jgi:ribosomal protein RSM22 (predicted rRNA methylase)
VSLDLPAPVVAALQTMLDGISRSRLALAAASMSTAYRSGAHSAGVVTNQDTALAYAVSRMPATYAAVMRALHAVSARQPEFAPRTLLDLGAGPGSATLAASAHFPSISKQHLVEPNARMRSLAQRLVPSASIDMAVVDAGWASDAPADLVVASYVLAEQTIEGAQAIARAAYAATRDMLLLVEPGTPHGFARLSAARTTLIEAGATMIAPCPHAAPCPLVAPDWCHFRVRLPRSRDHIALKGAEAPFEDEPFCYLAVSRRPAVLPPIERLLRDPAVDKGAVSLTLCTPAGFDIRRVLRRNKAGYKAAKAISAGDMFPAEPGADE